MTQTIRVGYAVGSGESVDIPVSHLTVTGQTQASGKTTTLEALASRAQDHGVTVLTFITKRGEQSFAHGRRVAPYFRDRADWQFVTSIIDATLQEKNKFLRPWIIKICRSTETLADVHNKVREAMATARGMNEGVYTQLDAYLEIITTEIARTTLASKLDLKPGLNVMDVSAVSSPMQMLFIQSAIDWVNEHGKHTIVVVPEAWEFIPEGKGSPVKASAIALVRKGAAIGNRIWVDSQDMAGVDKTILRGCGVFLIGVQREANEIKRNLNNIPASIKKPTAAAVALLERGQFFACWGSHAIKVYVQPAWLSEEDAIAIARGAFTQFDRVQAPSQSLFDKPTEEAEVTEAEARELREENQRLSEELRDLQEQYDQALKRQLALEERIDRSTAPLPPRRVERLPDGSGLRLDNQDFDALYTRVVGRLKVEAPGILKVLTVRPEMEVRVERQVIEVDGSSVQGRVARLIAQRFLDTTKRFSEVKRELERTGPQVNNKSLSTTFDGLVKQGFLTREGEEGYRAVEDMKVNVRK